MSEPNKGEELLASIAEIKARIVAQVQDYIPLEVYNGDPNTLLMERLIRFSREVAVHIAKVHQEATGETVH